MIGRFANSLKRVVEPTATWAAAIGAVTLGVMVVMLLVSVIMRKAFNTPMKGIFEMTEFGMVMITFLCMSAQYFKPDAMVMETFVEMLPKKMQAMINSFIFLLDAAILAILSWQLFAYALKVQRMGQVSKILEIPLPPFPYLGAACMLLLTLVFTMKFLFSLNKFGRD
jgi:TRAP-type C4-dicarboxylate transport system permease small subunit